MRERIEDMTWVALDLEATGVAFGYDRIIEIGAVRFEVKDGHLIPGERFSTLVNPKQLVPSHIQELTGLEQTHLNDAPVLEDVWPTFASFVKDTHVIAHGIRNDLSWLASDALKLGFPPLESTFHCTLDLSRKVIRDAPRYTLEALTAHLGAKPMQTGFHRALPDALHTRNLFAHCLRNTSARYMDQLPAFAPIDWPRAETFEVSLPPRLQPLYHLTRTQQRIWVRYKGGRTGQTPRELKPLGLFASEGISYLRAWCYEDDTAKTFRCERLSLVNEGRGAGISLSNPDNPLDS